MLSKPGRGSVETPWGCRSLHGNIREKYLNIYGIPMEHLWITYGVPMEYLWNNTVATPWQYRSPSVPPRSRFLGFSECPRHSKAGGNCGVSREAFWRDVRTVEVHAGAAQTKG